MELELIGMVGVLLVVVATTLAPRLRVASPLLLVALGVGISLLPFVEPVTIPPELILSGILPPLLYAAAVETPVMDFRRDFRMISIFSVLLVLATAVTVGFLFTLLVPDAPLGIGIALGAIVSPTDAVATSIVRRAGVSHRIVTVLEGESMLNDASALVLLRAAVASIGVGVSVWQVSVQFLWAVAGAAVIGVVVGRLNLAVRGRISQEAPNVALSLIVPFVAFLPAEELGASGLVAAVVSGLVSGYGAPKRMSASVRVADGAVWGTIALLLESGVFLLVGLELSTLVADVASGGEIIGHPVLLAVVLGGVVVAIRAVMVAWSLWLLKRRNARSQAFRPRLDALQAQLDSGELPRFGNPNRKGLLARIRADRPAQANDDLLARWRRVVAQRRADVDYLAAEHLGWREGVILVWAGMRGAVTIAAAQTLPASVPHRSLVILVAVFLAVGTLVLQGISLGPLARRLGLTGGRGEGTGEQWRALQAELDEAAIEQLGASGNPKVAEMVERMKGRLDQLRSDDAVVSATQLAKVRLKVLEAQRNKLLELRDVGTYPSAMMDDALAQLDGEQIGIELRQRYL